MGFSVAQAQPMLAKLEVLPAVDSLDRHLFVRELQLTVGFPEGGTVLWPAWKDSLGGLILAHQGPVDTTVQSGKVLQKQRLLVMTHQSGDYTIPTVKFLGMIGGKEQEAYTDPLTFTVETQAVDPKDELKPLQPLRPGNPAWWQWVVLGVAILLVIGGVIWRLSRREKPEVEVIKPSKKPNIPAYEIALKRLDELEAQKLWQDGQVKAYYIELTHILRTYIEDKFHIPAMESITEAIVTDLKQEEIVPDRIDEMAGLLELADLAKFAKLQPNEQQNQLTLAQVRTFIQDTKDIKPGYEQLAEAEAGTPDSAEAENHLPTNTPEMTINES